MDTKKFDNIAKVLDARLDRRRTARELLGVVLGGAALGAIGFDAAARKRGARRKQTRRVRQEAGGRGNSACAHFCKAVFPPGRERGTCVSEGARDVPGNLCDDCETDPARFCDGVCCAAGETCDRTTCLEACDGETCAADECCDGVACQPGGTWEQCGGNGATCEACADDEVCAGETGCTACATQLGGTICDGVFGPGGTEPEHQCGPGGTFSCACAERADGTGSVCTGNVLGCSSVEPTCNSDADCETLFPDSGWVCVRKGSCPEVDNEDCLGENVCAVPCDFTVNAARRAEERPRIRFADR